MAQTSTGGRIRALAFLFLSLGAAGAAAIVIYLVLQDFQRELADATKPEELTSVVVANMTLYPGRNIGNEDLRIDELPPKFVPENVLRQPVEVIGRVPRERILEREFIREERLANPEAGVGLNAIIPQGMRAISVDLRGGSAVAGFLNAGNYVDVIVSIKKGTDKATGLDETETRTLFQAVTVLAVNNNMGGAPGEGGPADPSVTLAVTPEDAEKLTHAYSRGTLTLTLRNDIDVTQQEVHGARTSILLGGGKEGGAIEITEWRQMTSAKASDGTLTIIRGSASADERIKSR